MQMELLFRGDTKMVAIRASSFRAIVTHPANAGDHSGCPQRVCRTARGRYPFARHCPAARASSNPVDGAQ